LEVGAEDLAPRLFALREPRLQTQAIDELQREHELAFENEQIVDRDDVRMREARHGPRFSKQPILLLFAGGDVTTEHLESDTATELRIVARPHDAHRPGAERHIQNIAADDAPRASVGCAVPDENERDRPSCEATSSER
jgi:hypothetical protein